MIKNWSSISLTVAVDSFADWRQLSLNPSGVMAEGVEVGSSPFRKLGLRGLPDERWGGLTEARVESDGRVGRGSSTSWTPHVM